MSDYKETTYIEGDVSIGEDVHIGGNVTQQGDSLIKGNVRIKGWLEAENIKDSNKGFYLTKEQLKTAYPEPRNGWWAVVGESLPGSIYAVVNGEWTDTGKQGGGANFIDMTNLCNEMLNDISTLLNDVETLKKPDGIILKIDHIIEDYATYEFVDNCNDIDKSIYLLINAYDKGGIGNSKDRPLFVYKKGDLYVLPNPAIETNLNDKIYMYYLDYVGGGFTHIKGNRQYSYNNKIYIYDNKHKSFIGINDINAPLKFKFIDTPKPIVTPSALVEANIVSWGMDGDICYINGRFYKEASITYKDGSCEACLLTDWVGESLYQDNDSPRKDVLYVCDGKFYIYESERLIDFGEKVNRGDLSDVALSGSYNDLKNLPFDEIPEFFGIIEEEQVVFAYGNAAIQNKKICYLQNARYNSPAPLLPKPAFAYYDIDSDTYFIPRPNTEAGPSDDLLYRYYQNINPTNSGDLLVSIKNNRLFKYNGEIYLSLSNSLIKLSELSPKDKLDADTISVFQDIVNTATVSIASAEIETRINEEKWDIFYIEEATIEGFPETCNCFAFISPDGEFFIPNFNSLTPPLPSSYAYIIYRSYQHYVSLRRKDIDRVIMTDRLFVRKSFAMDSNDLFANNNIYIYKDHVLRLLSEAFVSHAGNPDGVTFIKGIERVHVGPTAIESQHYITMNPEDEDWRPDFYLDNQTMALGCGNSSEDGFSICTENEYEPDPMDPEKRKSYNRVKRTRIQKYDEKSSIANGTGIILDDDEIKFYAIDDSTDNVEEDFQDEILPGIAKPILLRGADTPKQPYDVANKHYVDTHKDPIKVTHAELVEMVNAHALIEGQEYEITDYEATAEPGAAVRGDNQYLFNIIVKAMDSSNLSYDARCSFSDRNHNLKLLLYNSNINAWQIKYQLKPDNMYIFDWTDPNGKGTIFWLKDDVGNEAPFDFYNFIYKSNVFKVSGCEYDIKLSDIINSENYAIADAVGPQRLFNNNNRIIYKYAVSSNNRLCCAMIGAGASEGVNNNTIVITSLSSLSVAIIPLSTGIAKYNHVQDSVRCIVCGSFNIIKNSTLAVFRGNHNYITNSTIELVMPNSFVERCNIINGLLGTKTSSTITASRCDIKGTLSTHYNTNLTLTNCSVKGSSSCTEDGLNITLIDCDLINAKISPATPSNVTGKILCNDAITSYDKLFNNDEMSNDDRTYIFRDKIFLDESPNKYSPGQRLTMYIFSNSPLSRAPQHGDQFRIITDVKDDMKYPESTNMVSGIIIYHNNTKTQYQLVSPIDIMRRGTIVDVVITSDDKAKVIYNSYTDEE